MKTAPRIHTKKQRGVSTVEIVFPTCVESTLATDLGTSVARSDSAGKLLRVGTQLVLAYAVTLKSIVEWPSAAYIQAAVSLARAL